MFNKMMKNRGVFINSAVLENDVGKIEMYGDVYEQAPMDYWTGKKLDIQCITLDDFKQSLKDVEKCNSIELHLNSYGGDATVGLTIRNLLKATGKHTTCIIEGIAASAAFTIASGCDEVQVYKGSLMMCHRVMNFCFGFYNNDDLQQIMNGNDAYDNASADVYAEKTGMTSQQCLNLMKKVTWMTGQQAIDYGFADTLLEGDSDKSQVELVNKTTLKVNGVEYNKLDIPENILQKMDVHNKLGGEEMTLLDKFQKHCANFFQNIADEEEEKGKENDADNASQEQESDATKDGEQNDSKENDKTTDANNADKENTENGENKEDNDAPDADKADSSKEEIINAERQRIQEIESISSEIDADLVQEAKFGNNACDAKELAFRQMQRDTKKSQDALNNMQSDNEDSKSNSVSSEPPKTDKEDAETKKSERELAVQNLNKKVKEGK